ncbi:uncharacterized protein LOC110854307 [Folsomia candida]|uniref:Uncharacterized protein n=1 Tax=Folsomia candida TaxID=158441 RepID=A0A226DXF7_FOLCA|nr:uncharacterized protein LOC110854307 [Folsomia candida]OXA50152.1 hypothetical protein Fcan01_15075 [Folsomia candida]
MNILISGSLLVSCVLVLFQNCDSTREQSRFRRGAAYAGALGSFTKLTPSVALGTFGGHTDQPHGGYRKQTVQESLGSYGRYLPNRHGYQGKQTVQEALGAYGGHLPNPHGGYRGKQTVQEALGSYGGFVQGGHRGPNVIGNEYSPFNKD